MAGSFGSLPLSSTPFKNLSILLILVLESTTLTLSGYLRVIHPSLGIALEGVNEIVY